MPSISDKKLKNRKRDLYTLKKSVILKSCGTIPITIDNKRN